MSLSRRQLIVATASAAALAATGTAQATIAERHHDADPHSPVVYRELLRRVYLLYGHVTASQPQDGAEQLKRDITRSRLATRRVITCAAMTEQGFSKGKIHRIKRAAWEEARRDFRTSRDPFVA